MGSIISIIFGSLFGKKKSQILMIGLDAAGKTSILYQLKMNENIITIPTIGYNMEVVDHKNVRFTVWDVGGQKRMRPLWRNYFPFIQGLIFVVNSSDRERIFEAKNELMKVLEEESLKNVALLVFANKQDLKNSMNIRVITDRLGLHTLSNRKWHIQATCAKTGFGIYKGLSWLAKQIKSR